MGLGCGNYLLDCPVFIKFQPVYKDFTVPTRSMFQIFLINTMIYDKPTVLFVRNLKHRTMCRTVNFIFRRLYENNRLFGNLNGA